jgi:tetratricopeptide (TPR) repeat protein
MKLNFNRNIRIAASLLFFISCPSIVLAGEEDRRYSLKDLYLSPLQVISPDELRQLDTDKRLRIDEDSGIAFKETPRPSTDPAIPTDPNVPPTEVTTDLGPKSTEVKIKEAEGLLKRYYGQFIEEKRIWEDRERGNIYNSRSDQNDVRLLLWQNTHKDSETFIVRDSPVLYDLHIRAAKLYASTGKTAPSLRHYLAAFRYHPLDLTEEMYRNGEWQKEDFNGIWLGGATEHKAEFERLQKAEKNYEDSKDNQHLILASLARKGTPISVIKQEENRLLQIVSVAKKNFEDTKKSFETSSLNRFGKYLSDRQKQDSINLYDMANIVKKVEDDNKERLKIINKLGTAGKGIYVLFDYKRNVDFFAYELILEKAYSQWPDNPNVIYDIAEQYRQDSQKAKAIDFFERYANLLLKEKSLDENQKEKLINTYLRIATLNADIKRKVIAAGFYEKYFQISPDSKDKTRVSFEMGVFFATQLGDLKKANEFFSYWLERNSKDWNPSLSENTGFEDLEAIAFYHQSKLDKQNRKTEAERSKLNLAHTKWKNIDSELIAAEKMLSDLKSQKQKIKKDLLITTEDDALSKYRLLDIKIEDQEARLRVLRTKLDKIPVLRVLFRLGVLAEGERDFSKAKDYYDSVINLGGETEVQAALREKKRVTKILETGIIVPPFNESI